MRRVDEHPKAGRIVHVTIINLEFRRTPDAAVETWQIGHAPFSEAVLRRSVKKLDTPAAVPPTDFEESYAKWKQETVRGEAPHWSLPVPAVVGQIEGWIRKSRK